MILERFCVVLTFFLPKSGGKIRKIQNIVVDAYENSRFRCMYLHAYSDVVRGG
jgi:hypothetical protein